MAGQRCLGLLAFRLMVSACEKKFVEKKDRQDRHSNELLVLVEATGTWAVMGSVL